MTIDDVIVSKTGSRVELDVRVRNPEDGVANITRADLDVLERIPAAAVCPPSTSYELLVEGPHNSVPVAHVLQPNEVDRFVLRLGFSSGNLACFFKVQLTLHYNGDQRAISEPFDFDSCFEGPEQSTAGEGRRFPPRDLFH